MSLKAIFPIAVATGIASSSHALVINVLEHHPTGGVGTQNTGFTEATHSRPPRPYGGITNSYSAVGSSPWLDPISVSATTGASAPDPLSFASAAMTPSYVASTTGFTLSMGLTSLSAQYGRAVVTSNFVFEILPDPDDPDAVIDYSVSGNLSGVMDGGSGNFAFTEGRLENLTTGVEITEIDFRTNIRGAYDFSIDGALDPGSEGSIDGLLSGTLQPGAYLLYLEHELVDNSGGSGSYGGGDFSLVVGDGGTVVAPSTAEVPDGGATALLAGFSFFGLRFLKSKKRR